MKYRKNPIVIEAFRWTGDANQTEDPVWIADALRANKARFMNGEFFIDTMEGTMQAMPGDWIIQGIKGEIYPCKPDIFDATYAPVPDADTPAAQAIHPSPSEFTEAELAVDPILRFFHYKHLPPVLQTNSAPFCAMARGMIDRLPRNAERTVALRKLLEAKDCAVRASLPTT